MEYNEKIFEICIAEENKGGFLCSYSFYFYDIKASYLRRVNGNVLNKIRKIILIYMIQCVKNCHNIYY